MKLKCVSHHPKTETYRGFLTAFSLASTNPDPVGPTTLRVELDPAQVRSGSTALRVFWPRSAGHVDWYEVILEDRASGTRHRAKVMGSAATQSSFMSLVPGTVYTISVLAFAGDKSAAPVSTLAATGELHHAAVHIGTKITS